MQRTLPLGSIVQQRYVVEDLLGMGGFGAVYLVRDQRVKGNVYALKEVIDPNKEERARFRFEGEVLKRLDHPGLPRVYRTFEDDKNARAYMLLDYIEGPNLEKLRHQQSGNRLPVSQAIRIMAPIFDAVGYLHKRHPPIIHRDIKPANIIVPTGDDGAVLVDFGIAKEYDQEGTTTAIRRCSPGYGAPEQYARGTNLCTDIYGLGATFYALVTGQVPVDALHRMTRLGSKRIDPLLTGPVPNVPLHLSDAIHRAMAINSNDRFANVEEFWQALNAYPIEGEVPPAPIRVPAPEVKSSHVANSIVPDKAKTVKMLNYRHINLYLTRRHGASVIFFIAIVLFALLAGVVFGIGLFPSFGNSSHQSTKIIAGPAQKATTTPTAGRTVTPSAEPGGTPTPVATSTPVPTPTPGVANYPRLVNSYQGSIIDKFTQPPTSSTMSLSQIQQNETKIRGYLVVGPGLIGNGDFTGTVSTDNKIQFIVTDYQGILPLFFQGQIHADQSISGTYCSYQNNQCNYSSGYGDWNVAPSTSGLS